MNRRDRWNDAPRRGAAIGAALLIVAVGLCLVHSVEDDGMSAEFCAAMLATIAVAVFVGLVMSGPLPLDPVAAVRPVSVHPLDPPPRSSRS
jgi:hypothetical protein